MEKLRYILTAFKRKEVSAEKIKNEIIGIIFILLSFISVLFQNGETDGTAAIMLFVIGIIAVFSSDKNT